MPLEEAQPLFFTSGPEESSGSGSESDVKSRVNRKSKERRSSNKHKVVSSDESGLDSESEDEIEEKSDDLTSEHSAKTKTLTKRKRSPRTTDEKESSTIRKKQGKRAPTLAKGKIKNSNDDEPSIPRQLEFTLPDWDDKFVGKMDIKTWSMVKGKGAISIGEPVVISYNKSVIQKGKKSASEATVIEETIIRYKNEQGSEIGRLLKEECKYLSPLLDAGLIRLSGCVIDCPKVVASTDIVTIRLNVNLTSQTFLPLLSLTLAKNGSSDLNGAVELKSEYDAKLEIRKAKLQKLFKKLKLRPETREPASVALTQPRHREIVISDSSDMDDRPETPVTIAGEGLSKGQHEAGIMLKPDKSEESVFKPSENEEGETISCDQLNVVYAKSQQHDQNLPEMEPPASFKLKLKPYQKQALQWMSSLENGSQESRSRRSLHPLWQEFKFPSFRRSRAIKSTENANDERFYFCPHSSELSLAFPKATETCKGGILADEMGLGKTIMLAALIHLNVASNNSKLDEDIELVENAGKKPRLALNSDFKIIQKGFKSDQLPMSKLNDGKTTLVVAPLSLVSQWKDEMIRCSGEVGFDTQLFYGADRTCINQSTTGVVAKIIITTYGTLLICNEGEFNKYNKRKKSALDDDSDDDRSDRTLFDMEFFRVILDEAHNIRSRSSQAAKACYAISAERRWAVTGSPFVNKLEDIQSLLHFIQLKPWSNIASFRSEISLPFSQGDMAAMDVVQYILEICLLRREKSMRDRNGRLLVQLPKKLTMTIRMDFSAEERKIYTKIFQTAHDKFEELRRTNMVMKKYSYILVLIMRLRQAVNHPMMCIKNMNLEDLDEEEADEVDDTDLDTDSVIDSTTIKMIQAFGAMRERSSSKLEALAKHLNEVKTQDSKMKVVVFSQFTSFLDFAETMLDRESIDFVRLDGSVSQQNRAKVLTEFSSMESGVILISLQAGGTGLNLVSANRVILMDCWWNAAVEKQAIDRVHRIGQERDVTVVRFIVERTVEEQIMQIQKRKEMVIGHALGGQDKEKSKAERMKDLEMVFGIGKKISV